MKRTGTWHRGCPVALRDLRLLQPVYLDWSGRARTGKLVVHRDAARTLGRVFGRLYQVRFPIRRMVPVDTYGSPPDNDYRSIEADNTSAFNCRNATGSGHWSQHAYGRAVDVDPIENPYVLDGLTEHRKSRRYLDRTRRLKGMIHAGDRVERAFTHVAWGWGGRWDNPVDYQHFSATGT